MTNQKNNFIASGMSKSANARAKEREKHDYYATHPIAIDCLVSEVQLNHNVWECACGGGHLSKRLEELGHEVYSTDLVDRGYGVATMDFLEFTGTYSGDIVTNPPFKFFEEFLEKGLSILSSGNTLALLGKVQILEGQKRGKFFKVNPPKYVLVFSKRLPCAINGDFSNFSDGMQAYAWYVFEKGYQGQTILKWVNG